jgi:hypothetical protein
MATPESRPLDQLEGPLDQQRREAHRRLVHQQQARPAHQRAPDRQHLLLAAGEGAGELAVALGQRGEQPVDPLEVLGPAGAVAVEVGAHLEVLAHGHGREHPAVLRHDRHAPGDPVAGRAAGDVLVAEPHAPAARPYQPERGLQGGRFAGGVAAQQADQLAGANLQRDALEDAHLPVPGVDRLQAQQRLHQVRSARRPR